MYDVKDTNKNFLKNRNYGSSNKNIQVMKKGLSRMSGKFSRRNCYIKVGFI